ncbi:DNA-directed RNA polymerase subunit L [Candidatus Woesearchaeota archaeon]|nr:DNA-directed RNA polymerase subunit L [Candidatus Woesearchaeota archaeon]
MDIHILKEEKDLLEVEIVGEGHTFCNLLRDTLNNQKEVKHASYMIQHPLVSNPILAVRTSAGKPRKVFLDTLQELKKSNTELKTLLKKLA